MTSRFNLVLTSALLKPLLRYRPNPQMWRLMLTLCIRKHIQVQVSVKEMAYSTQLWRRSRKSITEEYTLYWSQNEANEFKAIIINTSAIPVVTLYSYCFNIINWKLSDIRLDSKTRKMLTTAKMHYLKVDFDKLYPPRTPGGWGLVLLELSLKTTTIGLNA